LAAFAGAGTVSRTVTLVFVGATIAVAALNTGKIERRDPRALLLISAVFGHDLVQARAALYVFLPEIGIRIQTRVGATGAAFAQYRLQFSKRKSDAGGQTEEQNDKNRIV
jgi:heme/copper-type cytochrome/quinol oxidase subunit 3